MKTVKRSLALALVLVLLVSTMALPAFAASTTWQNRFADFTMISSSNYHNYTGYVKAAQRFFLCYLVNLDYYIGEKYDELIEELSLSKLNGRKLGARGSTISGGEKNKIALARFLLPENACFFILDEPFTNIDILSIKTCLKVFTKYKPSKCGIIVSHNLQVIHSLCEEIIVMEEGCAPVVGKHTELANNNYLYNTLCKEYSEFIRQSDA